MRHNIKMTKTGTAAMMIATLLLSGCGQNAAPAPEPSTPGNAAKEEQQEVQEETQEQTGTATETEKGTSVYHFEKQYDGGMEEGGWAYTEVYDLTLLNDTDAVMEDKTVYTESYTTTTRWEGTYEKDADVIRFVHVGQEDWETAFIFSLEQDEVTDVASGGSEMLRIADAAGTYTAQTEDYGLLTLKIDKIGGGEFVFHNGTRWNAFLYWWDDQLEVCSYDQYDVLQIDWYVTLEDGSFSYVDYYPMNADSYEEYVGEYEAFGDLGVLVFNLEEYGRLTTSVEYNGQIYNLEGSLVINDETGEWVEAYLYDELGGNLSMRLEFMVIEPDGLNYSGTMTLPLGAG